MRTPEWHPCDNCGARVDGGGLCRECQLESAVEASSRATVMERNKSLEEKVALLERQLKVATSALMNMVGAFDTPAARLKDNSDFANAARQTCRDALSELSECDPSCVSRILHDMACDCE